MSGDPFSATFAAAEARVGGTLKGKWHLERLLGVGGMASVYEATHRNRKRAAVKMLHPELSMNASVRERFLREGYAANSVGHPGAVVVDDDDVTEDGCAFLVMELLEGETLEARWERKGKQLPSEEVLAIVDQVLETLAAAHDKGIVHRDLKPENLFLTRGGVVKVLDFGIARLRELSQSASKTQTGSTMGTPAFMPPEQARGRWEDVDRRSDLWAVGATMFTLLTGRYVHEAGTVNEALVLAVTEKARSVASLRTDVPFPVVELVDRALAYEKADRWTTAVTMQTALRRAYAGLHASAEAGGVDLERRITIDSFDDETVGAPRPTTARAGSGPDVGGPTPSNLVDAEIPRVPVPAKRPGALTTARGVVGAVRIHRAGLGSVLALVAGVLATGAAVAIWTKSSSVAPATETADPSSAKAAATAEAIASDRPPAKVDSSVVPQAVRLDELPIAPLPPPKRPDAKSTAPMTINLDEMPKPAPSARPAGPATPEQPQSPRAAATGDARPPADPFASRR